METFYCRTANQLEEEHGTNIFEPRIVHKVRASILKAIDEIYRQNGRLVGAPSLSFGQRTNRGEIITAFPDIHVPGRVANISKEIGMAINEQIQTEKPKLSQEIMGTLLGDPVPISLLNLNDLSDPLFAVDLYFYEPSIINITLNRIEMISEQVANVFRPIVGWPLKRVITFWEDKDIWNESERKFNHAKVVAPIVRGRKQGFDGANANITEEFLSKKRHLVLVPDLISPSAKEIADRVKGRSVGSIHKISERALELVEDELGRRRGRSILHSASPPPPNFRQTIYIKRATQ